ncbi:TPA: hypothetical protein QHZ65_003623 [Klebsiella aerogenes]|nr:hypothetical protein [Klebsiella aerogenes]
MNETVALRPGSRSSAKEEVIDDTLASLEELEQLHPALNLLARPPVVRGSHDFFVCCYDAGIQHAQTGESETVAALLGSLTHNRLSDLAGQMCASVAQADSESRSGFYSVRSISLPVYRRLLRDNHSHSVCLQQSLLHLLAWKSESPWARQQAQRLLWQGGVLGERGEFALLTLDDELRERQVRWPSMWSLLAVTGFLARFPAGPLFAD